MRLYIVRHGKAHQDSASGTDYDRELMNRGVRQAEWLGEQFAELDDPPTLLVSSPVVRARQTADIVGSALELDVEHDDRLDTETTPGIALEVIIGYPEVESLAIFGHNPTFSALASHISGQGIGLKTGQCLVVDCDPREPIGSGRSPELLRFQH